MATQQQISFNGNFNICGDVAAYEFYIEVFLQWTCDKCGATEVATEDIRDDEDDAPYGKWATRKAIDAMNQGWFVWPLSKNGALLETPCYCPKCTKLLELDVFIRENSKYT